MYISISVVLYLLIYDVFVNTATFIIDKHTEYCKLSIICAGFIFGYYLRVQSYKNLSS